MKSVIGFLTMLYVVQGLPFGFQTKCLPVLLRKQGVSLGFISSLNSILSLPWFFKVLWAPFVDSYYDSKIGRRRSWLIPTQSIIFIGCLLGATVIEARTSLFIVIFIMNFAASVQDIAVDGLAVDVLSSPEEIGLGNAAQSVGFKIGMLFGGGVLIWGVSLWNLSNSVVFLAMALIVGISIFLVLFYREPSKKISQEQIKDNKQIDKQEYSTPSSHKGIISSISNTWIQSLREVVGIVVAGKEQCYFLLFIATYKSGELMADVMFKPFLVDMGFTTADIGLWTGLYSMVFSILGSLIGGVMAKHISLVRLVFMSCSLRLIPHVGRYLLATSHESSSPPSAFEVIAVSCTEALVGGMLTTVVFSFMMVQVTSKELGGSHYTILTSVEVIGKSFCSFLSGPFTQYFGYTNLFLLSTMLSAGCMVFLLPLFGKEMEFKKRSN